MLIKMQKHRFAQDYMIIERASHVTYSDKPIKLFSEDEIKKHMQTFIETRPPREQRSVWYCTTDSGSGSTEPLKFPDGYDLNRISFIDSQGQSSEILFDGEAYLCNDEGKTIHRIRRGGAYPQAPRN